MANGSFSYYPFSFTSAYFRCDWSSTSTISSNSSVVTAKIYFVVESTSGGWGVTEKPDSTVIINGETYTYTAAKISVSAGSTNQEVLLGTITSNAISHNSDGSKTVSISFAYNLNKKLSDGKYYGTLTASDTAKLDQINRKSTLSASNGTLGTDLTLTVTKQASNFTHTITYKCGTKSGTICTNVSNTSVVWDEDHGNIVDLASENTAGTSVSVTFTITTYNGNSSLGSNTKTITCAIPSIVAPSCTLDVSDATGYTTIYGGYIQGLSKFDITVTPTIAYNSPIMSYSVNANDSIYTTPSLTTNVIKTSGSNTITATVKDKRGRSGSTSFNTKVLSYFAPAITSISVQRCNEDLSDNQLGEYAKITWNSSVTSLNEKNSATYSIEYKLVSDSEYTTIDLSDFNGTYTFTNAEYVIPMDSGSSYDIQLTIVDDFSSTTKKVRLPTGFALLHFGADGQSIAIGKLAETSKLFDIGFDTKINGTLKNTNRIYCDDVIFSSGKTYLGDGLPGIALSSGFIEISSTANPAIRFARAGSTSTTSSITETDTGTLTVSNNLTVAGTLANGDIPVPRIRHGNTSVSAESGKFTTVTVNFEAFDGVPDIVLTPSNNSGINIYCKLRSVSTSGFTADVYPSGSGTHSIKIYWTAMY